MKDWTLDEAGFKAQIDEAVKAEAKYIAQLTSARKIIGMGGPKGNSSTSVKEAHRRASIAQGEIPEQAERLA